MGIIIEILIGILVLFILVRYVLPLAVILVVLYLMIQFPEATSILLVVLVFIYLGYIIQKKRRILSELNEIIERDGFLNETKIYLINNCFKDEEKRVFDFIWGEDFWKQYYENKVNNGFLKRDTLYDGDSYYYRPEKLSELNRDIEECVKKVVDSHLLDFGLYDIGQEREDKNLNAFICNEIRSLRESGYNIARESYLQKMVSRNELIEKEYNTGRYSTSIFFNIKKLQTVGQTLAGFNLIQEKDLEKNFGKSLFPVKELIMSTLHEYVPTFSFQPLKLSTYSSETNTVEKNENVWINDKIEKDYQCSICGKLKAEMVQHGSKFLCMDCLMMNALDEGKSFTRPIDESELPPGLKIK